MLRIRDHEITRTPQVEIPQVVQCPLELFVPIGLVTTMRTRLSCVDAPGRDDLWRWQVGNRSDPFSGIGSIRTWTDHGCVLRARMLGPPLYDKSPSAAISKPGEDAIVSIFTPINAASMMLLPPDKVRMGAGLINIMQQGIGGTVGLAMMTTMLERHTAYHASML